ncbi:MAG: SpoIID/LytB domain-containing protein [Candidatus Melainabacteria bacterium]|nr:SpoIID/LytB domain-containing protein [Candidatus Melainabacteria bacterium]
MKIASKNSIAFILALTILFLLTHSAICKEIKIGLLITSDTVSIGSSENASLRNLFTNTDIARTKKLESYILQNINGFISVTNKLSNTKIGAFTGPLKLTSQKKDGLVYCNMSWYRGELLILTNSKSKNITIVNNVDLEDYLLSVVPSEISHTWNKEVLKAQSVAARSYALGYLGRRKSKGYDLESSIEDQVYKGVRAEKKATSHAVKETRGVILVDSKNKPLIALYHSSGGGYTDSIENLWDMKPSIHIQPRPDYDNNSPYFKWYRNYKIAEVNKLLSSLNLGEITNILPISKSISNRITWIKITGTTNNKTIRGEEFRKYLNLPSSKFNISIENNIVKFAGRGYGHGLGLSQWGAKALAEKGFTYKQILSYYYPGATLVLISNDVKM